VAYGGNVNPPRNRKGGSGNPPPKRKRTSALSRPPFQEIKCSLSRADPGQIFERRGRNLLPFFLDFLISQVLDDTKLIES